MSGPLLTIGLVLGSLLFQQTAAFTVKLLGNENTFGEAHVAHSDKEREVPIPNGRNRTIDDVPTSDEVSLNLLSSKDVMTIEQIDAYLEKYGYLKISPNGIVSEDERKEAIKEFQRFSKIKPTGVMDSQTMLKMRRARCGLADPVSNSKFANFDARGTRKWSKKHLTYRIYKYSQKLSRSAVRSTIAKAYKAWSDASQLTFTEVFSGPSDMKLRFTDREHGDNTPFDGKGGVLAHAFYPQNGEIHMEEEENWTVKSADGINLLFVMIHEIGHSLGLGHSDVDDAIMAPFYSGYVPDLQLSEDDVAGIQYLYGKPKTPIPTTKAPTTKAPTTQAPTTKAPTTQAPTTKAPTTQAPTTKAPTTQAPTTKAPTTQAPTTKSPATQAPTTKTPTTEVPITKAPTTKAPATEVPTTKAPATEVPTTKAPITRVPTTGAPTTGAPITKVPTTEALTPKASTARVPTTNYPEAESTTFQPQTTEPEMPRIFPCPFRFWAAMTVGNRTFGFYRFYRYEIVNGRITSKTYIRHIFPKAPYSVGAAAHNEVTGQTFLFRGRFVYRFTDQKLDRGFPKRLRYYIRSAVVVDDQLIAFSFSRVHYLDQDTMEDYVDGEVKIEEEYPGIKRNMRAIVSYGDGFAHVFYTNNVVKLDVYSGELTNERCKRNRN